MAVVLNELEIVEIKYLKHHLKEVTPQYKHALDNIC